MTFKVGDIVRCLKYDIIFSGSGVSNWTPWRIISIHSDNSVILNSPDPESDYIEVATAFLKDLRPLIEEVQYIPTQEGDKEDDI
jgi:hypothetical protein